MTYTVRYAHLENLPAVDLGQMITRGSEVGFMGNSGASFGAHLHIDCVEGSHRTPWSLQGTEEGILKSAHRQLNYFIDRELFDFEIVTTTPYNCPDYMTQNGKVHLAYDVVPEDRWRTEEHYRIFWNRTPPGIVIAKYRHPGYGNCVHIQFEA